jgi:EAL domain-containing protein (putative c-di-GMP-specific phosphodiesterase class I)
MDDFGTGYSSLSYLRSFPFDKIKIDQSFVRELGTKTDCMAIIRAVTGMCDSLGITATAEGVETAQQLSFLQAEKCTEIQGYLVSKPRPAREIAGLIHDFGRMSRQELFQGETTRGPTLVPDQQYCAEPARMTASLQDVG